MLNFLFSLLILSSLASIFSKNPVQAVLFLILSFLLVALIFLLIGAEFLALLIIIVYVGAISILFLFIVMMLNLDVHLNLSNLDYNMNVNNLQNCNNLILIGQILYNHYLFSFLIVTIALF